MRVLALVLVLLLVGCVRDDAPAATVPQDAQTDASTLRPVEKAFQGSALATPVQAYEQRFTFGVPDGAVGVNATLAWSDPTARFTLQLLDPRGDVAAKGRAGDAGLVATTVEPPHGGDWTIVVGATLAANVAYDVKPWRSSSCRSTTSSRSASSSRRAACGK